MVLQAYVGAFPAYYPYNTDLLSSTGYWAKTPDTSSNVNLGADPEYSGASRFYGLGTDTISLLTVGTLSTVNIVNTGVITAATMLFGEITTATGSVTIDFGVTPTYVGTTNMGGITVSTSGTTMTISNPSDGFNNPSSPFILYVMTQQIGPFTFGFTTSSNIGLQMFSYVEAMDSLPPVTYTFTPYYRDPTADPSQITANITTTNGYLCYDTGTEVQVNVTTAGISKQTAETTMRFAISAGTNSGTDIITAGTMQTSSATPRTMLLFLAPKTFSVSAGDFRFYFSVLIGSNEADIIFPLPALTNAVNPDPLFTYGRQSTTGGINNKLVISGPIPDNTYTRPLVLYLYLSQYSGGGTVDYKLYTSSSPMINTGIQALQFSSQSPINLCYHPDTKLKTPRGFIEISNLHTGDSVYVLNDNNIEELVNATIYEQEIPTVNDFYKFQNNIKVSTGHMLLFKNIYDLQIKPCHKCKRIDNFIKNCDGCTRVCIENYTSVIAQNVVGMRKFSEYNKMYHIYLSPPHTYKPVILSEDLSVCGEGLQNINLFAKNGYITK